MILGEIGWKGKEIDSFELDRIDQMLVRTHRDGLACRTLLLSALVVVGLRRLIHLQETGDRVQFEADPTRAEEVMFVTGYRHPVTRGWVGLQIARRLPGHCIRFSDRQPTGCAAHPDEPRA